MPLRRNAKTPPPLVIAGSGVVLPAPVEFETPVFTGSLPMLFTLVREGKIELLDVPLTPICEAYFRYLLERADDSLDEAAAALAALAFLIERKAWLLLPIDQPEPDELELPMELPEPTSELFGPAIEVLRVYEEERSHLFFRSPESGPAPYELPFEIEDVTPEDLARALARVLARAHPEPPQILNKPRRSIADQMVLVLRSLSSDWSTLDVLVEEPFTRTDVVYWFLALLELTRIGQVAIRLHEGDVQFALAHSSGLKPS